MQTTASDPDEWDIPCSRDLPCSFVSQTGAGVITITAFSARCKRFERDSAGETTTSSVYWRTIHETTTRQSGTKQFDVYELSTAAPKSYRYETTITVEGVVSADCLASGKTRVVVCESLDGYYDGYSYGIDVTINPDGTFSGTKTVPIQISGEIGIYQVMAE